MNGRRKLILGAMAGAGALALAACGGGSDDGFPLLVAPPQAPDQPSNLVALAQSDARFTVLVAAVVKADLVAALSGSTELTVFAPTNDAFDSAAAALGLADGNALVDALPAEVLGQLLQYHVAAGKQLSSALSSGPLTTLYTQGDAATTLTLDVSNGVQITDALLTTANVTAADLQASNGVIHVIDKVLIPPGLLNVVQMAQLNPQFTSLVQAVLAANLQGALAAPDASLTVFAPVNAAFEAIAATAAGLTVEQLSTVLTYHVLGDRVLAADIPFGQAIPTLAAQSITIEATTPPSIKDSTATPAQFVAVDVLASNGVIHVINKVLLPSL